MQNFDLSGGGREHTHAGENRHGDVHPNVLHTVMRGAETWREKNQWLKKGIDVQKRESMELGVGQFKPRWRE